MWLRLPLPHNPTRDSHWLQRSRFLKLLFHPRPTLSRGLLWRARASPVSLQTHREMIPVALRLPYRVLAMAVANAILWQEFISIRIRLFILLRCVSRIPVEHKIRGRDGTKNFGCFSPGRGVASRLIFENQNHIFLGRLFSGTPQFFIDGRAIRRLIIKPPEIEEAHAIGIEGLCQLDAAFKNFILLLESKIGLELIALGAVL